MVIFARWLVGKNGKQGELIDIEQVGEALGSKSLHHTLDFVILKTETLRVIINKQFL